MKASWEKCSWGNKLHIWLGNQSRADFSIPCDTFAQAKQIAKSYKIMEVHKQCQ